MDNCVLKCQSAWVGRAGGLKVQIDQKRCRGHAKCLDIAPDAFDFIDEEDRAVVVADGVLRTSVEALMDAQLECPEQAICVEDDDSITAGQEGPK
jgi:ferredoxin